MMDYTWPEFLLLAFTEGGDYLLFQFSSKECITLGMIRGSPSGLNILRRIVFISLFSLLEIMTF